MGESVDHANSVPGLAAVTGFAGNPRERIDTVANAVTVVRTVAAMILAVASLAHHSMTLLVIAYLVYWVGDSLDGLAARSLKQETLIGAIFDIVSDRACTTLAAAAFITLRPEVAPAIAAYLIQFCVFDTMLTLGFLYFPGVTSPNYFWRVDRLIYQWNWSVIAKTANTTVVVLLCIAGLIWVAFAWAVLMGALKLWSLWRLRRILTGVVVAEPKTGVTGTNILGSTS